jgi:MoCo/4Fe-4S cofactor protein with predicted Tat translocation signal
MSQSYWRSLRELAGDPEFRALQEREFPAGAEVPPEGVTRREMLTLLGASISLAGLTGCRRPEEKIVPYVIPPETIMPGIPRHYATTMPFGRSAYGLVVESHEGRPTKIEGNPAHPSTAGASSLRTQASILGLYDPDRSQTVRLHDQPKTWPDLVAAWKEIAKAHAADGGAGLAVLSAPFASPTLARLAGAFRDRYPNAHWATWEPIGDETILAGIRSATGRSLQPVLHLDKARVILTLDADPLLTDPESVRHIAGFAQGRRAGAEGGTMNRLWAVEAVYSLTGAMADHRLRLQSNRVATFAAALAARLRVPGAPNGAQVASSLPGVPSDWIDALADDLHENRGQCLIVAGERQPAAVHAAVFAINAFLGNVGTTVTYHKLWDATLCDSAGMRSLVEAMHGGAVRTLVILGGNPVYDAPADLDFAGALAKTPTSIALTHAVDETATLATWHIPRAHYLEAWGDARAADGTLSVVQPLIAPLFGGKSDIELLGLIATGTDGAGYDHVVETWKGILGESGHPKAWEHVLHDGVLPSSALPAVVPEVQGAPFDDLMRQATAAPSSGLEVVFVPSAGIHDGRFANDAWLQELPDPLTKLTWDNPALISPKTAAAHGVANEDVVTLTSGGRSLDIPVWIVPGLVDDTVVLTLGYGRTHAGRIGTGVGFNAYALRAAAAPGFMGGVGLTRTARAHRLVTTQEHGSMEGRDLVRETTPAALAHGHEGGHEAHNPRALFPERTWDVGHQWGMTIDLNACVGCNACMVACQAENNVPVVGKQQVGNGREMHWIRVDRYFTGDPAAAPQVVFQPVPCMQCEDAPCEQVCPVGATVHDSEGLNVMVYNRCLGTRYCSNNCPYKVRRFNFFNFTKHTPQIVQLVANPNVTVRARGVMEKCTYCTQRITAAKIQSNLTGRELTDGDVRTACQQACPAGAIEFGDLRDAQSRVARAKQDPRNYALLEELNVRPRTTYLTRIRNPHPKLAAETATGEVDA